MNRTIHTLGSVDASRCSVCRHADREDLDRDLVLRRRTQADVARIVGVDRSTVSRHVKNHVMPALAEGVILETKDVALGNLVEAFDTIYGATWSLYERASGAGDLRLAGSLLQDARKVLEIFVRFASKIDHATLPDAIGRDPAMDREHYEEVRRGIKERLDVLADRHRKGIQRPDSTNGAGESADSDSGANLEEGEVGSDTPT